MYKVCILLSTYNGEKYLQQQIDSLYAQINVDVRIFVRDDGSNDQTIAILKSNENACFSWYRGSGNIGPAKSFMELIKLAPECDYYAFCDQDDYWKPEKLSKAISLLKNTPDDKSAFYYSNVNVTDENLNVLSTSDINVQYSNLKHVMMHNSAIGCTVVFNNKLRSTILEYNPEYIYMHDWWLYQVCLVTNGIVIFDHNSYILYRQHDSNAVGFYSKRRSIFDRVFKKAERINSKMALELLKGYKNYMSEETYCTIYDLANYTNVLKCKFHIINDNSFFRESGKERLIEKLAVIRNRK